MNETQYIDGFVDAIGTVFHSFSERQITCKSTNVLEKKDCVNDISVVIGIIGDIKGNFYMSMNAHTSQGVASELLGGMEVEGMSELVTSAVSELGNMIMGNACSIISDENMQVDITPPTVVMGENITFSGKYRRYCIPVELQDLGIIDFDVALHTA